jgi:hypothetical protein
VSRWIILIMAFLIAGAVINVAVASWFALTTRPMPVRDFRGLSRDEIRPLWEAWGPFPWSELNGPGGMLQTTMGRELQIIEGDRSTDSEDVIQTYGLGRYRYGWPRRSLGLVIVRDPTLPSASRHLLIGGLPVTDKPPDLDAPVVGAVPAQPLWGGFVVNTLVYALMLAFAFAIPIAVVRYVRHRRGRCIRCGYPLGASGVCTECGRSVRGAASK